MSATQTHDEIQLRMASVWIESTKQAQPFYCMIGVGEQSKQSNFKKHILKLPCDLAGVSMAIPRHIFSAQHYILLEDDNDNNLKAIQTYNPRDGKLVLCLRETFNDQNLFDVSDALSLGFERWKLTNVW